MSTFSNVINILPVAVVNNFRSLEKVKKKIISAKWSFSFNQTCLKEIIDIALRLFSCALKTLVIDRIYYMFI